MNSLASWQLLLFLCATAFGEPLAKVAPVERPRPVGQRLGALALPPWEQSPRCATERMPAAAGPGPSARGASPCALESSGGRARPGLCAARSRLIPAPRGAVLVQREKDLSAYNWNSFGLRYGKRGTARG
uniref:metastasis-suppressor KiSS-1 n=1 Tax=Jaculus jaculus TaxID=51337 RepID=UPI001E1B3847|nr:metastasis-suppressor KiSS-1 [Jaculus jaculus]